MQSVLSHFGSNFIISSFIPALGFMLAGQIIFDSILPGTFQETYTISLEKDANNLSLLPFVLTILLGFTLMGLNTFMYKLLEGYMVLEKIPQWKKRGQKKALKRQFEFQVIDKVINNLAMELNAASEEEKERILERINAIKQRSDDLKAAYHQDYPNQIAHALPTRFGNILRAAEEYSNAHYAIDAVTMWPRLIYVMDPSYYKKVDQSNNSLAFVVNSLLLATVLFLLCLLASGHEFFRWRQEEAQYAKNSEVCHLQDQNHCDNEVPTEVVTFLVYNITLSTLESKEHYQSFWRYLILAPLFLGIAFFFYLASLPAVKQYGNMIRSSYDLFRFNLLEQLRLPLPPNLGEEFDLWKAWSEFVAVGSSESLEAFPYYHPKTQNEGERVFKDNTEGVAASESNGDGSE